LSREAELIAGLPERLRTAMQSRIERERVEAGALRDRGRRRVVGLVESAGTDLGHVRARLRTLSPQSTLDRGYAVVRRPDGTVVRDAAEASGELRIRVARGEFDAVAK
jgi:exodeoxyribonuclease VII large subunit